MVRIQLAGIPVQMNNRFPDLEKFCHGYETDRDPVIKISVSSDDLEQERNAQTGHFSDGYLETVCMYRKLAHEMLHHQVFLLHASVLSVDGRGYGFMAPSGTGKTTQTRLWMNHFDSRLKVINGDKPLIRMVSDNNSWKFIAYGTPWQGKESMGCNEAVPLHALFLLERCATPSCVPATPEHSVDHIFRQVLLPEDEERMEQLLSMIDNLLETVPVFVLRCNMEDESVTTAYQAVCQL